MKCFLFSLLVALSSVGVAQITGKIKVSLSESHSEDPIPFATVKLLGTSPLLGGVTDLDGRLTIEDIPIGRYDVEITYTGYQPTVIKALLVTSGKEALVETSLAEVATQLDEVVISSSVDKLSTMNPLAGISARMLSVEEANRYAGGFDDPARLATSFAGVASGIQNNGIVIRGNNPNALLWRMEGVEVPNPNHFADLDAFGGGGITALSSQVMANSDFLMGAFPAAYSNAVSGVFDLSMRQGNSDQRESTFQIGLLGIDAASEGPLSRKSNASYLFNYRYSMLGLLEPLLPEDAGGTNYQDLSFKFKFPTKSF
ncbi:MAG: carboxypeptidase-like regulatory domain-containing protein, partial [Bacteroidota bacterium]